ncbi:DUF6777 domain-containing protein [Streptomyces sp. YU58]|uniref:DUF6777 domain-containing protein n=1 Tax=Streptomyces sp. SX92 TaxID=3158972 RepID=UPI0027BAF047|nr:DUF6777 domain-containing protein [Streptomyces coralus]WLW50483.1 hypothetical protein QU709_03535 [Streptomyces coralus]
MRTPTGTLVTACTLSAALLVAGCGGDEDQNSGSPGEPSGELLLQPVAAPGPDPFTESTATSTATPPPVTRTQQPARPGPPAARSLSGGTPGLYGGVARVGSCDVDRQIDRLTRDRDRARAFARVEGIDRTAVPDYLRGLAPVALRADTRVTNHGYRDGRATAHHAVLQAGTAVLVDNRGVPRVRCACGNPLTPPATARGGHATGSRPWVGYRPAQVIVVAPTDRVVTDITILDSADNTWIERRIGHDVRHDRVLPDPQPAAPTRTPTPSHDEGAPSLPPVTPPTADTAAAPTADLTEPDVGTTVPDEPAHEEPPSYEPPYEEPAPSFPDTLAPNDTAPNDIGPETVPETPDPPDGGGLIPDAPPDPDSAPDS